MAIIKNPPPKEQARPGRRFSDLSLLGLEVIWWHPPSKTLSIARLR